MNKLEEYLINNSGRKILLLVSGGSSFGVLDEIEPRVWNKNITIGMIDERYSRDFSINNFGQMKARLFWKSVTKGKCGVINSEIKKGESLGAATQRTESAWKKWKKGNKNGLIVVLLGMGDDGHTAGIMPYPEDKFFFEKTFVETENWVVGYDCGDKNQYRQRITATINFLENKPNKVFLYLRGEKKELVFDLRKTKGINELPISFVDQISFELL